jgi:hypothetical protein
VPQLCDRLPELLDVQCLLAQCNTVGLALGQQQRLQRLDVVRQVMFASGTHPAISRGSAAECNLLLFYRVAVSHQPATCGRQLRCGRRQSIPSSR